MPIARDPFAALRRGLRARRPLRIAAPRKAQTSVALILAPAQGRGLSALLIKRVRHPADPWSGQISLPGGHREAADADRLATCLRETSEETGIALLRRDLLGELDDLSPRTPTYPELAVRPFVFGLRARPPLHPGPEAAACFWIDLRRLRESRGEKTFVIGGGPRLLPVFRLGRHTVWGITYRILASLLELEPGP